MKENTLKKFRLAAAAIAAVALGFVACNTEDVEPNIPAIEVNQTMINAPKDGGEIELAITSNRQWTLTTTPSEIDWMIAAPRQGSGDATVKLSVGPNTGMTREATLRIANTSNTAYVDVRITQVGAIATELLYADDFGTTATQTGTQWPLVSEYTGWNISGSGSAAVTYSSEGGAVSARTNSASSGYEGASGSVNVMMAAAGASFIVNNIDPKGMEGMNLSFGSNETSSTLKLFYSTDGATWTPIDYEKNTDTWGLVQVSFDIPTGSADLHLKFTAASTQYGTRIDDLKLTGSGASGGATLMLSSQTATPLAEGGTYTVSITSNTSWEVTPDAANPWCGVSPLSGSNNDMLTLDVEANTGNARTAVITIKTTDGTITRQLTVTQAGAGDAKLLYADDFGTTANQTAPWTLISEYTGWNISGSGSAAVTYSSEGVVPSVRPSGASSGYEGASGSVNVMMASTGAASFIVNNIDPMGMEGMNLSFGTNETSTMLKLFYSTDGATWTPIDYQKTTDTWALVQVSFDIPAGSTELHLKFTSAHNTYGTRIDDLKLTGSGASGGATLTLVPAYAATLSAEANTYTVSVTSNTDWEVTPDAANPWCDVAPLSGSNNGTLTLDLEANTGATARSAVITVKTTDGTITRQLTVTQEEAQTPTDLNIPVKWDLTAITATENISSLQSVDGSTSRLTIENNSGEFGTNPGAGGYVVASNWAVNNAWLMTIPITSFTGGAVDVTFDAQSSATGRRDFAVEWSADGTNWSTATPAEEYTLINANATKNITINPSGITTKLYIRLRITTNISVRAGTGSYSPTEAFAAGGTSRITATITVGKASAPTPDPVVTTNTAATTIGETTATVGGSFVAGTDPVTEVGVEYKNGGGSYTAEPAIGTASPFTVNLTGLAATTQYTFRAYAKTGAGTFYGSEETFTTNAAGTEAKAIADIRALKTNVPNHNDAYTITNNWSITGRVVSDKDGGNLNARNFALCDGTTANSGILIRLPANHSFDVGDEVTVDIQNASLVNFNGLLQIELSAGEKAEKTSAAAITPSPVTVTETQLKTGNYESMYVEIANTQIINGQLSGTMQGSITMEIDGGGNYTMFTASSAVFRTDPRPAGSGTLKGIASVYNSDYQVQPRNAADTTGLTGARFGAVRITLAEWDMTTQSVGTISSLNATTGSGTITTTPNTGVMSIASGSPNYLNVAGSTAAVRWDVNRAWIIEVPVTSFTGGAVDLTFNAQSSATGPRDFAVEWSADGTNWSTAMPAEEYTLSASNATKNITINPSGITSTLYIRLRVTADISVRAGTGSYAPTEAIGNGGTSRITGSLTIETTN